MNLKDLNIHIEGNGQPMILLHGWGMSEKMMNPIFQHFNKYYRVCNMDLPGFGKSKEPDFGFSVYDYVNVLKEIIKVYQLKNPIIIAHSFGARIAFHYASLFSVKYLIITGGAGIKPKRGFDYYFKVSLYKAFKILHIQNDMGSDDFRNASKVMRSTLIKVVNEDSSKEIEKIEVPILLVWGEKDQSTPIWMAHKIMSLNHNATLITFKNDDHFAYYHQINRFIKVCEHALKGGE